MSVEVTGAAPAVPACRAYDPDLWFPVSTNEDTTVAESICGFCPIRQECLDGAIERNERHGVWGGVNFLRDGTKGARRGWHA